MLPKALCAVQPTVSVKLAIEVVFQWPGPGPAARAHVAGISQPVSESVLSDEGGKYPSRAARSTAIRDSRDSDNCALDPASLVGAAGTDRGPAPQAAARREGRRRPGPTQALNGQRRTRIPRPWPGPARPTLSRPPPRLAVASPSRLSLGVPATAAGPAHCVTPSRSSALPIGPGRGRRRRRGGAGGAGCRRRGPTGW